ncbi:Uncharacterized protein APZ42_004220 [Daphnia magna]|uniref:Uncharacterized protein n=1 Tax=Daphnia magna TaxID=35525 RepID=A0A164H6X9_9CRUS|nr:Uncharacterized protein APZ42_004220 [Daphnia magna]
MLHTKILRICSHLDCSLPNFSFGSQSPKNDKQHARIASPSAKDDRC